VPFPGKAIQNDIKYFFRGRFVVLNKKILLPVVDSGTEVNPRQIKPKLKPVSRNFMKQDKAASSRPMSLS
ncbi:MAG: hypothetical protein ACO1NZ_08635, partial [Adhaeribacter sp.]